MLRLTGHVELHIFILMSDSLSHSCDAFTRQFHHAFKHGIERLVAGINDNGVRSRTQWRHRTTQIAAITPLNSSSAMAALRPKVLRAAERAAGGSEAST